MLQQMTEVIAQQNASTRHRCRPSAILPSPEHEAAQAEIEKLRLLIRQLQRGQFGRRSEKLDPDQLQLGLEDLEQTVAAAEAAQEEVAARSSTPRPPRFRRRNLGALPAHLPRVEVLVDVEDKSCPCCGGSLHVIGEDTSEMLDIVPAQLRVKVIRRPRYGCRACEEAVVQAPAPERPITGGMATEALLAHVLVAKYCRSSCRSTARRRSSPGKASSSTAPRFATGSGGPAGGWSRCGACCAGTSWARPGSSPTTRPCRCSTPAGAGPRPAACGATPSTTGPGTAAPRRRWSTSTPRTARASTRPPTWPSSRASCRWTAMAASRACWRAARRARSGWPSAGRIAEGASTRSTRPPARRWRRRRCGGSASSTRSRPRSAAARPRSGARPGRNAASRSWRPCTPGSPPSWSGSRASPPWPRRSATPCATGRGWCCSSRTAGSSSTPTPSSGRSGRLRCSVHCTPLLQVSVNIGSWFS